MKITKFEHACFTVEKDGQVVVVDPGNFTTNFVVPERVVAIVITHEHQDHFEGAKIQEIIDKNPDTKVYAHQDIVRMMEGLPAVAVAAGETVQVGNIKLEFFGGQHAMIHSSLPIVANLGVMIEDRLYHPGDALALPGKAVEMLLLPISAPWLKLSECVNFANYVKPVKAFPTHDAILSDIGKGLHDRILNTLLDHEIEYIRLAGELEA